MSTSLTEVTEVDTTPTPDPTGLQPGYEHIEVRKVSANIGAEIWGVRASGELDDAVVAEIRRALLQHRAVFLRGQDHLDDAAQRAFGARFGALTKPHPTVYGDGVSILPIDSGRSRANSWHTDVTFVDRAPAISMLRAVTLPPYGGATVFANTVRAYDRLHPGLKALVDELWALHTNTYDYAGSDDHKNVVENGAEYRKEFTRIVYETEHPVVRVHPETSEPALLLGHFVRQFVGLSTPDSNDVFTLLQRHITALENTVQWQWHPGDVAMWDNRATQHYGMNDYDDLPRLLHRITLAGEIPVSLTGEPSRSINGDSADYAIAAA